MLDAIADAYYSTEVEDDYENQPEPVVQQVIPIAEACQMMERLVLFEMQRGKDPQVVEMLRTQLRKLKWER
jgi:hypothetical protein